MLKKIVLHNQDFRDLDEIKVMGIEEFFYFVLVLTQFSVFKNFFYWCVLIVQNEGFRCGISIYVYNVV
jgi:hypothetical protein